jgi:hypothetical protein
MNINREAKGFVSGFENQQEGLKMSSILFGCVLFFLLFFSKDGKYIADRIN